MAEIANPILDILCGEEVDPDWYIPNLFTQGSSVVLAGEAGAGKSYVSYLTALAAASGLPAMGGIIPAGEPRCVLYFDEENSEEDRNKYLRRAWKGLMAQNKIKGDDEYKYLELLQDNFWPMHFVLGVPEWEDIAVQTVEAIAAVTGRTPHAIYYDTATPCFDIEDENNNSEATEATKAIRRVSKRCTPPATSIVIKHANLRTDKGLRTIRGAKAWKSAVDGLLFQVKANGRPRKDNLKLTRLEPDKIRAFGLQQTIYITPQYVDANRNALVLIGSYSADKAHTRAVESEEDDDE